MVRRGGYICRPRLGMQTPVEEEADLVWGWQRAVWLKAAEELGTLDVRQSVVLVCGPRQPLGGQDQFYEPRLQGLPDIASCGCEDGMGTFTGDVPEGLELRFARIKLRGRMLKDFTVMTKDRRPCVVSCCYLPA